MIVLSVLSGGCRGQVGSYDHLPVLVGRNPGNDLQLSVDIDLTVSGRHAEIRKDSRGYMLHDLGSSNGTLLNGQKIDRAKLKDGDVIQFGLNGPQVQFGVRQETPEAAGAAGRAFYCPICTTQSTSAQIVCPSCARTLCEIHRIPQYGICNDCVARGYQKAPAAPSAPSAPPAPRAAPPAPRAAPPAPRAAPPAPRSATPPPRPAAPPPQQVGPWSKPAARASGPNPAPAVGGSPMPTRKKPMRLPTMGMMLTPDTVRIDGDDALPPMQPDEMPPPLTQPPPLSKKAPPPLPPGRLVHGEGAHPGVVRPSPPPPPRPAPAAKPLPPPAPATGRVRLPSAIREAAVIPDDDEGGFFTEADFRTTLDTPVAPDFELRLE